jgi:hypothetical protein
MQKQKHSVCVYHEHGTDREKDLYHLVTNLRLQNTENIENTQKMQQKPARRLRHYTVVYTLYSTVYEATRSQLSALRESFAYSPPIE